LLRWFHSTCLQLQNPHAAELKANAAYIAQRGKVRMHRHMS
jgi:hypothetical protein